MGNKSIYKNAIYKMILNVFNIIVPILIGPYALSKLGTTGMGRMDFSLVILNFFMIFAGFGIYTYGLREISRIREDKLKLQEFFGSLFILGFLTNIITSIVYVIYIFIVYKTHEAFPVMLVLSINFLSNIFYVEWINEAMENYDFITKKTIVVRIVYVILLLAFIKSPEDYVKFAVLNVIWGILNNAFSFTYIKRTVGIKFSNIKIKRHIKSLILVIILSNVNILFTTLDAYMLGKYLGVATTSYYKIPQNIMTMINTIITSIVFVSIPQLSNFLGKNDEEGYLKLLDKVSETFFAILFPAAIGMFCLANEIIVIYGGNKILPSIGVFKVFSIYMISLGLETILTQQVIYINKKEKPLPLIIFICGILNLIGNILLIKLNIFSPQNSIITTMISNFILIGLEYIYIRKVMKIKLNLFSFSKWKYLIVSMLFIPITILVKMFVTQNIILVSIITMILCASTYVGIFYITKDRVLLEIIDMVLKKVKKNK